LNVGIVTDDARFKEVSKLIFEVLNPNTGLVNVEIVPVNSFESESEENLLIG